jgi:hypothetical protein
MVNQISPFEVIEPLKDYNFKIPRFQALFLEISTKDKQIPLYINIVRDNTKNSRIVMNKE